jgi:hypothetical protein
MIIICRKSPNEARQRPIPDEHEHGQARREEGPGLANSTELTKGKEVITEEEWPPRMIKSKSLKDGQWLKNEGS